ncbi:MAG: transposase [Methylomonas sp.]|jgi:hypothetical protein|uniref:transposase n=1 Tax=Methylomonas sp. TaxID=418 RepID=UPI0025D81C24|nr:transposase [Methylomonas sp.]MCK9606377.1 transposase [Methylomonas sp.]
MHKKQAFDFKNRAPMIQTISSKQLTIAEFDWPFETVLDKNNRWVKLSECIPWDELAESYYQGLSADRGRPLKDARLVIGAVIIKHKLCLSDVETVLQIQKNPYLQYFVGLPGYQAAAPFAPSLLVEIRKHRLTRLSVPSLISAQSRKSPVTPRKRPLSRKPRSLRIAAN